MDCTDSKEVTAEQGQIIYINGYPCSGKTFMGDYLCTLGWHMVDGDAPNYSTDMKLQALFGEFYQCFDIWAKGEKADPELWKPYYQYLIEQAVADACKGKDVVISFVCFKREIRDYIRTQVKGIKFIHLDVNMETLLNRNTTRFEKMLGEMGMSFDQGWKSDDPDMVAARAEYGEDYDPETYKKWMQNKYYRGFEEFTADEPNCYVVDQNDFSDNKSIRQLHKILDIEAEPKVDVAAIEAVQMARYAQVEEAQAAAAEQKN